jgi:thiol-disulfide isomerase/thioredoxin
VILNFWATWCPPCKAEIHHIAEFYKENHQVVILAVNLTTSEKSISHVENFVKNNNLPFPVVVDTEGKVGDLYKAVTIPTSYIIDRNGVIQQRIVGPMSKETLENLISTIN